MTLLPKLVAILAMILPPGNGETPGPDVPGSAPVPHAVRACNVSFPVYSPAHLPSPRQSFFECLDETALDEEDSTRVEDHGIASPIFLGFEPALMSYLFCSCSPTDPLPQSAISSPILRC
jgi:hypothetical protein